MQFFGKVDDARRCATTGAGNSPDSAENRGCRSCSFSLSSTSLWCRCSFSIWFKAISWSKSTLLSSVVRLSLFLSVCVTSFGASLMECTGRLVAAVSQGPTPTVRGLPPVSSAAIAAAATWEGFGQSAQPRGRFRRPKMLRRRRKSKLRWSVQSNQQAVEPPDAVLEHAQLETFRGGVEGDGRCRVPRSSSFCRTH